MFQKLTDTHIDALREIINIGNGHAASALSSMIDRKIEGKVPSVSVAPIGRVPELLGGSELPIVGIYFRFTGAINGNVLLFLPADSADQLVDYLVEGLEMDDREQQEEIRQSAIMELGNILANAYLNAVAEMMDVDIYSSVPYYSKDLLGAVVDVLLIQIAENADYALLMDTEIETDERKLKGNIAIFLENDSLEKIFEKIGLN